mmetsp:Transcript_12173/g.26967  ORF Transcript_12173/g.26967 Transcript_12173/m.26967 type:complete len:779 (-) Transcript_12173:269-2605(-)
MDVTKRSGSTEAFSVEKLTQRLSLLTKGLNMDQLSLDLVVGKVAEGLHVGITTLEVDSLASETAAYMSQNHPDYSLLAARIAVTGLYKTTDATFSGTCRRLAEYQDKGKPAPLLSEAAWKVVQENADVLDAAIQHEADFAYDFFAFKTLERSYLLRCGGEIVERPQHLLMRCSIGIHMEDIQAALETYELLSRKCFTHASPTLFNAATPCPQMSSCFLLSIKNDSISGIYETLTQTALISKSAGGIGVAVSNVRASGSYIRGTNGSSSGLVPMLRVFNDTARYVDQGGGKRKGSFAMYLEPWHADVFDFLELRKNHGKEEQRARDLFYALWIPDLFMERVKGEGTWTLFCPNEAPGLQDAYGSDFKALYEKYEAEGRGRKTIPAQQLWFKILESQVETGTPYMLYKDPCNEKSNQKNLGTIRCSNLCTEIIQFTSADEVAVCNLASIALPTFVKDEGTFDFEELKRVVKVATRNLNKVIERNFYPVEEARRSNFRHRPIGLGVQGLADAFMMMRLPFESDKARRLNTEIFETLYFGAVEASCELAEKLGPYETYQGSPMSEGKFQFDLWGVNPDSGRWDWEALRARVKAHGVRNSLLVAPMPTASTAQILGNNESFEPYTQNMYTRRVLAGEFVQVNKHLLRDLVARGLWGPAMKQQLMAHNGSVQKLDVPQDIKELYKTVWEIKQKCVIDMAADRGAYIDQSQSLNIHMVDCTTAKLSSMHFYGWKRGLKTGQYYLRTQAAADAIKFTVDVSDVKAADAKIVEHPSEQEGVCLSCSG